MKKSILRITRKIHLYSGLIMLWMVLMYTLTGYVLTNHELFKGEEIDKVKDTVKFNIPSGQNHDELSAYIKKEYKLKGQPQSVQVRKDCTLVFAYQHPLANHQMVLDSAKTTLFITKTPHNFHRSMVRAHRLHGYGSGWYYNIYAFVLDITAISMIIFALSGIYMWLSMIKHKWLGWVVLLAGFVYMLLTVWTFIS